MILRLYKYLLFRRVGDEVEQILIDEAKKHDHFALAAVKGITVWNCLYYINTQYTLKSPKR